MTYPTVRDKPEFFRPAGPRSNAGVTPDSGPPAVQTYAASAPLRFRLLAITVCALGLLLLVATGVVAVTPVPADVLTGLIVLAAVALLATGALLVPKRWLVRFDEHGYRLRMLRAAGVTEAAWTAVENVTTATVEASRVVVLTLDDGRRTIVPVEILAVPPDVFADTVLDHLEASQPGDGPLRARRRSPR